MRTAEELKTWYKETSKEDLDFLGFQLEVVIGFLPKEQQVPYLKEKAAPRNPTPITEEEVLRQIGSYMAFAWEKVLNHRGISASRSVQKMQVWLYLLENDSLLRFSRDDDNYCQYGAPILKRICEEYKFPIPKNERALRMAKGLPCNDFCEEGCMEEPGEN